jgi:hypothetical protein
LELPRFQIGELLCVQVPKPRLCRLCKIDHMPVFVVVLVQRLVDGPAAISKQPIRLLTLWAVEGSPRMKGTH